MSAGDFINKAEAQRCAARGIDSRATVVADLQRIIARQGSADAAAAILGQVPDAVAAAVALRLPVQAPMLEAMYGPRGRKLLAGLGTNSVAVAGVDDDVEALVDRMREIAFGGPKVPSAPPATPRIRMGVERVDVVPLKAAIAEAAGAPGQLPPFPIGGLGEYDITAPAPAFTLGILGDSACSGAGEYHLAQPVADVDPAAAPEIPESVAEASPPALPVAEGEAAPAPLPPTAPLPGDAFRVVMAELQAEAEWLPRNIMAMTAEIEAAKARAVVVETAIDALRPLLDQFEFPA